MKSYIYPKLLRAEMDPRFTSDTEARYNAVNAALRALDRETLVRQGLRRARQKRAAGYEPFGVSLDNDSLRVLESLPTSTSRSALIQWILSRR